MYKNRIFYDEMRLEKILKDGWEDVQHYKNHKSKKCKRCIKTKKRIDAGKRFERRYV